MKYLTALKFPFVTSEGAKAYTIHSHAPSETQNLQEWIATQAKTSFVQCCKFWLLEYPTSEQEAFLEFIQAKEERVLFMFPGNTLFHQMFNQLIEHLYFHVFQDFEMAKPVISEAIAMKRTLFQSTFELPVAFTKTFPTQKPSKDFMEYHQQLQEEESLGKELADPANDQQEPMLAKTLKTACDEFLQQIDMYQATMASPGFQTFANTPKAPRFTFENELAKPGYKQQIKQLQEFSHAYASISEATHHPRQVDPNVLNECHDIVDENYATLQEQVRVLRLSVS